jgi:hypothetical protein
VKGAEAAEAAGKRPGPGSGSDARAAVAALGVAVAAADRTVRIRSTCPVPGTWLSSARR